jgi:hypothetical protein
VLAVALTDVRRLGVHVKRPLRGRRRDHVERLDVVWVERCRGCHGIEPAGGVPDLFQERPTTAEARRGQLGI